MNANLKMNTVKPIQEIDWAARDTEITREGTKIILPNDPGDMSYAEARRQLKRAEDAENMIYTVNEGIHVHFFDGLVALSRALKEIFGYSGTTQTKIKTFFGTMEVPPKLIHVKTGPAPHEFVQVPFGTFQFPNVDGEVETKYSTWKGIPILTITGSLKSKDKKVVMEIVEKVRQYAKDNSIYKGKSIVLERDESGGIDYDNPLEFFDPNTGYELPIFNPETEALIETTLLAPVANAQVCRDMHIPLKRGILLEGPYGCGKTLTARQTARVANSNDWTFITVSAATALKYALTFAKMYQPCVVFAEDIDRVTGNRNEGANDLINDIDGVVGKNDEIITVLTTNFASQIDKAFLRPGRLDTVVSIRPPEKEAVERLIRHYASTLLDEAADLNEVSDKLAGNIPATIREVVERSKLNMIVTKGTKITTENMIVAATGMQNHLDLINNAAEGKRDGDPIVDAIAKIVYDTVGEQLEKEFSFDREKGKAKKAAARK